MGSPETFWNTRIVGHGMVSVDELDEHPENWRNHPEVQRQAMEQILERVGWVREVLVNQETGNLVDGHLRLALARARGEKELPVVYVQLSEEEERLVLATFDPLAGLAEVDRAQLESLAEEVTELSTQDEDWEETLRKIGVMAPEHEDQRQEPYKHTEPVSEVLCPACGKPVATGG